MASEQYPLYPQAVILPALAFPAWILCIPPFVWHFSQHNLATWSLISWFIILNLFNSINPLIWPRDNVDEWWSGSGLCDIEIRLLNSASIGLAACTTMMMRKLAKVMDTRNITVSTSRSSRRREKFLEAFVCWGYPAFMMLVYYFVQPLRYYIYGISGCVSPISLSWVTIVLDTMWPAITICFAGYYAGLLLCRLARYRREFRNLIAARNTTKSRFLRLFIMSMISTVVLVPYSFWILWLNVSKIHETYSWSSVHGPDWNNVIKVPSYGSARIDSWPQVAFGYVVFLVFGTGHDAENTYKRMACAIGLGKLFPSLYDMSDPSSPSSPSQVSFARGFASSCASKAKTVFSRKSSVTETLPSRSDSVSFAAVDLTMPHSDSFQCHLVPTNEPMLPQQQTASLAPASTSIFSRFFTRRDRAQPVLPLFTMSAHNNTTSSEKSPTDTCSSGVYAKAWASDSPTSAKVTEHGGDGVHIVHEVRQDSHAKDGKVKEGSNGNSAY